MGGRGAGSASSGKKAGGGGSLDIEREAAALGLERITKGPDEGTYKGVTKIDPRYNYELSAWFRHKENLNDIVFGAPVFGILKETEKAVYAMVYNGVNLSENASRRTLWVPKSQLRATETPAKPRYDSAGKLLNPGVITGLSYDDMSKQFRLYDGLPANNNFVYHEVRTYWGQKQNRWGPEDKRTKGW